MTDEIVKFQKQKQRDEMRKKATQALHHPEAERNSDDLQRMIAHEKESLKHREQAKKVFRHE